MSNLVVDTLTNQDVQLAKAWVNFKGTGTVTIRSSYNVSSITDNGTGNFTIAFGSSMSNNFYSTQVSVSNLSSSIPQSNTAGTVGAYLQTLTSVRVAVSDTTGSAYRDPDGLSVNVFGGIA